MKRSKRRNMGKRWKMKKRNKGSGGFERGRNYQIQDLTPLVDLSQSIPLCVLCGLCGKKTQPITDN
ncbi:MAG: hypothetical protein K8T10_04805 [Candidatus Eremiobacteraeota bacterium]|nr:hypothetical protein [Candidatus Eremiobacteraeota bacterium]